MIFRVLAFYILLGFLSSQSAYPSEIDIGKLVGNPDHKDKVIGHLDSLPDDENLNGSRSQTVKNFISKIIPIGVSPDQLNKERLYAGLDVLCEIKPWTTGSDEEDIKIQNNIWFYAKRLGLSPWDELFAVIDCAAANKVNFYFDDILQTIRSIRDTHCIDARPIPISKKNIELILNHINKVSDQISNGLEGSKSRSVYPLRNSLRIALLNAYLGVLSFKQRDNDKDIGRGYFKKAAKALDDWNNISKLNDTRSGWRLHSDLELLSTIYHTISSDDAGEKTEYLNWLRNYAENWPEVQNKTEPRYNINPELDIPDSYIDPIYINRLLPGAAETINEECNRWRFRSYDTRKYGDHAYDCLKKITIDDIDDIRALDDCMSKFIAMDWGIAFSSIPRDKGEGEAKNELKRIKRLLEKLRNNDIYSSNHENIERAIDNLVIIPLENHYQIVVTQGTFNTNECAQLEPVLKDKFSKEESYCKQPKQY